jgi:phospholipid/cholesterol/gamma-HCH transport system substrate-binding protein
VEAKFNFAVVGAFVLVLGTSLIGGVLWLTSGRYYGKSYDTYLAFMTESVAGLNLNAPVKYRGVDVGLVRKIALDPQNVERVQLTLSILRGTPVKDDTIAILQTQGLTGIAYVELTGGRKDSPPLVARQGEDYPVIRSGPSLFARLDTSLTTLIEKASRSMDSINALLDDENRRAISQTMADLRVVSRTLAQRSATIDAALADAGKATANAARFTADLPTLVKRIERSADAFDRMTASVAAAGTSAGQLVEGSRGDVARFTGETLPEVRELVTELREVANTLRRTTAELERHPGALVWGKPPPKPGPGEVK